MIAKTTGFLLRRRRGLILPTIPETLTGALVSFESAAVQPIDVTGTVSGHTGKNLIETTVTAQTYRGLEIVLNADKYVYIDGETSNTIGTGLVFGTVTLPAGTYTVNGFTGTSTNNNTRIEVRHATLSTYYARMYLGNEVEFTLTETTPLRVIMVASTGVEIHATLKLMIRAVGDSTYERYKAGNGSAALLGVNNVWTESGTLTAVYKRFAWQGVT